MKIVDLEVADVKYAISKDMSAEVRDLKYHQKYLLLDNGNEVLPLEIDSVTDSAFYLKICDKSL